MIKILASSLGFLEAEKLHSVLDWCFDALVVLLEQHPAVAVKVAAAEAAVVALDLVSRHEELDWTRINDKDLVSALHSVLRDEDWGTDETRHSWKRTVEELVSMVDSRDFVVEIPFIASKGQVRFTLRMSQISLILLQAYTWTKDTLKADKSLLFSHRNKKGKAVAGWSDAMCVTLVRDILGYTFSELSHIGEVDTKHSSDMRAQNGFSACLLSLLARHPAADAFAEHVHNLREHGSQTRFAM